MRVSEKGLIIISCALIVVGLGVLYGAILTLEHDPISSKEFFSSPEVRVVIEGEITDIQVRQDMQLVSIKTECELPGVIFNNNSVNKGFATIIGTKKYYRGKPEIIIEQVKY